MHAEVFHIEFLDYPVKHQRGSTGQRNIQLSPKATYRNNGMSIITEDYVATKAIKEKVEIFRIKAMTSMTYVTTSGESIEVESELKFPTVEARLVDALIEAYTFNTNSSTVQSLKFTKKEEVEYLASEHIEIPPCSEYTVNSYVKTIRGSTVDYILLVKIQGQKGSRRMTSTELKDMKMDGMDFVEEFDKNTIIARANGTIKVDFGSEIIVEGDGFGISGCRD